MSQVNKYKNNIMDKEIFLYRIILKNTIKIKFMIEKFEPLTLVINLPSLDTIKFQTVRLLLSINPFVNFLRTPNLTV